MGYVPLRLPDDATPEVREQYMRHLVKAYAARPFRSLDNTPVARYLDAHPELVTTSPEGREKIQNLVPGLRPKRKRWWRRG